MKLIIRSIRPYRVRCILSILLLIGEAALCLASPVLLGRVVHIGVQCKGFDDAYPKALSEDAYVLFLSILPQSPRQTFAELYTTAEPAARFGQNYASGGVCRCVRADADPEQAAELYRTAVFSAVLAAREAESDVRLDYADLLERFSKSAIRRGRGRVHFSEAEKEDLYCRASDAAQAVKTQAGEFVLPYLYEDAGIDCRAMQRRCIASLCVQMAICAALQCGCALGVSRGIAALSCGVERDLRRALTEKTIVCTEEDLRRFPPELLTRLMRDGTRQIGMSIRYGMRAVFYSLFLAAAGCVYCFASDWRFGVLIAAGSSVTLAALYAVYKVSSPRYERMQAHYGQYSRAVRVNLRQAFTIRSLTAGDAEKEAVHAHSVQIRRDERFVAGAIGFAVSFSALLVNWITALLVLLGGRAMLRSSVHIGTVISAFQISLLTVAALLTLEAAVVFAPRALAATREIQTVLNSTLGAALSGGTYRPDGIREIAFCAAKGTEQAEPITCTVQKGETVVFTGPTGVGKSALLRALLREQSLCAGEIRINGTELSALSPDYPGAYIAYAPCRPVLFTDTVRGNMLLYGAQDDAERMRAALRVCACDFLYGAHDALDVMLENGGENLSGGQRSRLALACALAKEADVYILDDCLTAVDSELRQTIQRGIGALTRDAAVLIVTQDAQELQKADKVVPLCERK